MLLPEEIVTSRFLPTFRCLLAEGLKSRGLKENAIAKALGLSQAAISKYLRRRIRWEEGVAAHPEVHGAVGALVEGLAKGSLSPFQALARTHELVRHLENRDLLCRMHEEAMPALRGLGCNLCVVGVRGGLVEDQGILSDVRVALRTLEDLPSFASLIPNVGSNLAMARRGAKEITDVAAIPGRIYEARGHPRIPAPPEFGASRHVAEVVLALHRYFPSVRAAANIRFDESILKALKGLSWSLVEVEASYEGRREKIAASVAKSTAAPDVIFHRGAFGVEPIAYVVGTTATGVVSRLQELLRAL